MNADGANNNNAVEEGNGIDIGILNGGADHEEQPSNNNNIDDSTNTNDQQQEDENSYVEPSSLYDVYSSLNYANYTGNCCVSDKADGTTLTPALPTTLGLRVNGVGDLPLPLSDWHAKTLKSNRNTVKINNGTYHKSYTVDSNRIRIKNPTWTASLEKLVKTVAYKLGVDPSKLSAELHSLLYMEKGSRVDRCKNTDEGANVLGTLFVQLPSVFTGGKVSIFNTNGSEDNDDENDNKEEEEDAAGVFQLGAAGDASFSCHFFCHYKDCEYEFAKIKSGSRVLLRYTLRYGGEKTPTSSLLHTSMSSLKWSLEMLPPADRMLLIPMAKEYTALSLLHRGINALSSHQRSRLEGIKAAVGEGWKILIVTAELNHSHRTNYYGETIDNNKDLTVLQFFDEAGSDVTAEEKWLEDIVDFDPVDEGMMFADPEDGYVESWGACTEHTSSGPNYYGRRTTKKKYRASFILAYDTTYSESELKCLSGSEGVAAVADKVVSTKDYALLDRMLKVVEKKEKSKFDMRSCEKLLQMLTRSRSQHALSSDRVAFVNKILSGLSSTQEPDDELYNMILSVVDKFGHDNITGGISAVLDDEDRLKKLTLAVYLSRAHFILTLNKQLETDSGYLDKTTSNLTSSGATKLGDGSNEINSAIFMMIEEHGWEEMTSVVQATLTFLHDKIHFNNGIDTLLNRADLIWKLHDYPCDFIQSCLVDFAQDFPLGLGSGYYLIASKLKGDDTQKIFVKAICYLMAHGTVDNQNDFGQWAKRSEDTLSSLLTAITTHSTELEYDAQVLLCDILNKCLAQHSTTYYSGWSSHPRRDDRTVDPSLHIQRVLKDHPNLPRMVDRDGRITLHYAAASSSTAQRAQPESFEHILKAYPEGASVVDPITGLYPFMLAAGNGEVRSVSSTFSLLLADPSLVGGIFQEDEDTNSRKRKRGDDSSD